jgi:hypothetical protein
MLHLSQDKAVSRSGTGRQKSRDGNGSTGEKKVRSKLVARGAFIDVFLLAFTDI